MEKYETPQITDHGDLTELTATIGDSGNFDADFQEGQPIPTDAFGSQP